MGKRILALVMAVLMLLGSSPLDAWAERVSSNTIQGATYYTVTFTVPEDATGSAGSITQYVESGAALVLPESPNKAGYRFIGWFAGDEQLTAGMSVTGNLNAEARFEQVTAYTVTVIYKTANDSGDLYEILTPVVRSYEISETEIDTIDSPATVDIGTGGNQKLRYPNQATITIDPQSLTEDVTYVVLYTDADTKYTVRHLADALDTDTDVVTIDGTKYVVLKTEVKDGVVNTFVTPNPEAFAGMQFVSTQGVRLQETNPDPIDMFYERQKYTLIYDSKGGSSVTPQLGRYGETLGVYTSSEGDPTSVLTCTKTEHTHTYPSVTASKSYKGQTIGCYECVETKTTTGSGWKQKTTYTYSWQLVCTKNEHTHSSSCYTTTGGGEVFDAAPTRLGYTFGGWYLDEACTQKAPKTIVMTENVTVYAKWTAATVGYSVVFLVENVEGGYDYLSTVSKQAYVGNTVSAYDGAGSFTNSAYYHFRGEEADGFPYSATVKGDGSTVVYGLYDLNTYYLTFDYNGQGSNMKLYGTYGDRAYTITCKLGEDIASRWPSATDIVWNAGKTAQTFGGWHVGSTSGTTYASKRFNVTTDMLTRTTNGSTTYYYADWPSSVHTVYLHYWLQNIDGTDYEDSAKYYQESVCGNSGFGAKSIDGFTVDSSLEVCYGSDGKTKVSNGSSARYFNFYYTRNEYTLDFYYGSEKLKSVSSIPFEKDISGEGFTPTAPDSIKGYVFQGWYTDAELVHAFTFDGATMPAHNMVLYAKFTPPEIQITFKAQLVVAGGQETWEYILPQGSVIPDVPTPTCDGYTFKGWFTAPTGGDPFDATAQIMQDTVVYGQWKKAPLTYTVKYLSAEDGSVLSDDKTITSINYNVGQVITEKYVGIDGYRPDSTAKTITLKNAAADNVITFYYSEMDKVSYTVNHIIAGENAPFETQTKETNAERVVVQAMSVDGYYPDHEYIAYDLGTTDNIITFTYYPYSYYSLTVRYFLDDVEQSGEKVETKVPVGKSFLGSAYRKDEAFQNAEFIKTSPWLVTASGDNLELNVYYRSLVSYTVYYKNKKTGAVIDSKTVAGNYDGETVTEQYKEIAGFELADDQSKSITLNKAADNTITFWYTATTIDTKVTIKVTGFEKTYDGTASSATYAVEGLPDGYTLTATLKDAELTDADSKTAAVSSYYISLNGQDMTAMFTNVDASSTDLVKVNPRAVTLTSGSAEKAYDGTALTKNEVTITEGSFVEGEGYTASVTGAQVNVGSSENTFDVTLNAGTKDQNYTITKIPGTLTVTENAHTVTYVYEGTVPADATALPEAKSYSFGDQVTVAANASAAGYTFSGWDHEDFTMGHADVVIKGSFEKNSYTLTYYVDGEKISQKTYEFGADVDAATTPTKEGYTFSGWDKETPATMPAADVTIEGTFSINSYKVNYLVDGEAYGETETYNYGETVTIKSEPTKEGYTFSGWSIDEDFNMPAADVTIEGKFSKREDLTYTVHYYLNGTETDATTSKTVENQTFGDKVTESPIDIDGYTPVSKGDQSTTITTGDNEIIFYYYKNITLAGDKDEYLYDGTAKEYAKGITVTGELEGYAADISKFSLTLKKTAAGEYAVSYATSPVGKTDGTGKYIITEAEGGKLIITKRDVTIQVNSAEYLYDGKNHTVTGADGKDYTVTGLADGHSITLKAKYDANGAASKKEIGVYTADSPAYNGKGTDVKVTAGSTDVTANYNVTYLTGTLTIKADDTKITISLTGGEYTYDGTAHTVTYSADGLPEGYTIQVVLNDASLTDKGTTTASIKSWTIKDENGVDVTKRFTNVDDSATAALTINPVQIKLTSATDTKAYDGKALTNGTVTVTEGSFVPGEGYTTKVTGSQLDVGESDNTFEYTLNKNTKAQNYAITLVFGTLTVTPKTTPVIIVTANSNEKLYDGTALVDAGYTYTENALVSGDILTAVVEGSQTDAGNSVNKVVSYKVTRGDTDVTGNYTFGASVDGTLTVTKRSVTLTSATDEKVYDGTALTNDTVTVSGDGFVDGEGATYTVTGSQTVAGSSDNAFEYTLNEGTKAENYIITKTPGTLTVTPVTAKVVVTITENSGTATYDGQDHIVSGYTVGISNPLYTEDDFTFSGTAEVTGKDAGEYSMGLTAEQFTNESSNFSNVEFVIVDGTLTIEKRNITLTSASDEKTYDGTPLTNDTVTVSGDGFVDGEGASYDVTGSQQNVGASDNTFEYTLTEGTKAENYNIQTATGTLTVTKGSIQASFTVQDETLAYTGEVQYGQSEVAEEGLLEGHTAKYTYTPAEGLYVGVYENGEYSAITIFDGETDVTENYVISATTGILTITPPQGNVISKSHEDKEYGLGETVTFTITAINIYNEAKTLTFVEQEGVTLAKAEFANVQPGATVTATATYTITEADILAGQFKNTATVKYSGETTEYSADDTVTTEDMKPELTVAKTSDKTQNVKTGDVITYTVKVTNSGNVTITALELKDSLVASAKLKVTELAPGESDEITYTYTVTEADIVAGKIENAATVTGTDPKGETVKNDSSVTVKAADIDTTLTVTKTSDKDGQQVALGETITYTITVKNDGNVTFYNVKVVDEKTGLEETIDELGVGEEKTFTTEWAVTEAEILAGKVLNSVTAKGDDIPDPDPDKPAHTPEGEGEAEDPTEDPNPDFTLDKECVNIPEKGYFTLGETAEFTITAVNTGNLTLKNLTIAENLTGAKILPGEGYSVEGTSAVIAEIKPGETVVVSASYTITRDDLGQELKNVVTGTGEGPEDPDDPGTTVDPDPVTEEEDIPTDDVRTFTVTKTWIDRGNIYATRPATIALTLYADGEEFESAQPGTETEYGVVFDKLPVCDEEGNEIVYTVKEETAVGYLAPVYQYSEDNLSCEITNRLSSVQLTVRYWKNAVDGETMFTSFEKTCLYGEKYSVTSPVKEGYTVDLDLVEGVILVDTVLDVIYTPGTYTLTVNYIYKGGRQAAPTVTEEHYVDEEYLVESPHIEGYNVSRSRVIGSMPGHDVVVTVIYSTEIIEDYETPLGVGASGINVGECFE